MFVLPDAVTLSVNKLPEYQGVQNNELRVMLSPELSAQTGLRPKDRLAFELNGYTLSVQYTSEKPEQSVTVRKITDARVGFALQQKHLVSLGELVPQYSERFPVRITGEQMQISIPESWFRREKGFHLVPSPKKGFGAVQQTSVLNMDLFDKAATR